MNDEQDGMGPQETRDGAFIAASRTLLPALADALEETQEDMDEALFAIRDSDISLAERILSRLPDRLSAILDSAFAEKPETGMGDTSNKAQESGPIDRMLEELWCRALVDAGLNSDQIQAVTARFLELRAEKTGSWANHPDA